MREFLSIGEAAKRVGVSVQTLRHYDKLRLLIPSQQSAAGYRLYSLRDCERLQLIRALRELGFALDVIAQLLDSKIDPSNAIELQLAAVEAEQRALKRRQLILKASMAGERQAVLARLQRKHVLTKLDRLEREHFLARHLNWRPDDSPANQAVWRAAVFDLPEEMDEAQLEAWIELAEIAADDGFRETLERQRRSTQGMDPTALANFGEALQRMLTGALQAAREKRQPDDESSQALLDDWVQSLARCYSCEPDAKLVRELISHHDPRISRYWQLVSKLKGLPIQHTFEDASNWLLAALRARLDQKPAIPRSGRRRRQR